VTLPIAQKAFDMNAAAPGLIFKDDDRRRNIEDIATIRPEIGSLGFTLSWIELLYRGFIGMQYIALPE